MLGDLLLDMRRPVQIQRTLHGPAGTKVPGENDGHVIFALPDANLGYRDARNVFLEGLETLNDAADLGALLQQLFVEIQALQLLALVLALILEVLEIYLLAFDLLF